jgi:hypothetical protein
VTIVKKGGNKESIVLDDLQYDSILKHSVR